MRWRIPLVVALALFVAVSCDQQLGEPQAEDTVAPTAPTFDYGAVVWRGDLGCQVPDGNGDWFPAHFEHPCGNQVATFSNNGNASIRVRVSGAPNPTGKTVHWGPYNPGRGWEASYPELTCPPYPCFLLGTDQSFDNPLFTVKWHAVVTPSGEATLVCQYKEAWEFHCEDYDNCAPD